MIRAEFFRKNGEFIGFLVTGHANSGKFGQDIVCASVSSAIMLTANTITDFLHADAKVKIGDNAVALRLNTPENDKASSGVIASLKHHLTLLDAQQRNIQVIVSDT